MIKLNEIATCRNCRFYQPKGHKGGECQQFQVMVNGNWATCKLASPAFAQDWQTIEDLPVQIAETTPATCISVAERKAYQLKDQGSQG